MAQNGGSANMGHAPHDSGLSVGSSTKEEDVARIRELEEEVRYLADRANQASQKFADYENETRTLEAKLRQEQRKNADAAASAGDTAPAPERPQQLSRFGSLMRKPSSNQANGAVALPAVREKELEEKLVKETTARIAAEKKVREVNAEIEDLSTTLFQQANEMVAAERRENAGLVERIRGLEAKQREDEEKLAGERIREAEGKKREGEVFKRENAKLKAKIEVLEKREGERRVRLERLERAGERIERVRGMLGKG